MRHCISLLLLILPLCSIAQLRLPALVSSGMVLQQQSVTRIHGWAGPGSWVKVTTGWDGRTDSVKVSNLAQWSLPVRTPGAGGPFTIRITSGNSVITLEDILIGEVWLCSGQSNMEWSYWQGLKDIRAEFPTALNRNIRLFHIAKTGSNTIQDDVKARWLVCDSTSLKDFSAVGYFFGKRIHGELNVPVGLINASWGGTPAETWVPEHLVNDDEVLREAASKLSTVDWWPSAAGKAYNAMIAPLTGHAIAGVIWYQGESNVGTYSTYRQLMETLIASWRKAWEKEFPFYFVQIAPYDYGAGSSAAFLREQQSALQRFPHTGMVVVSDLVDNVKDIHPVNKHDVGLRLGNLALGHHYGLPLTGYRHPVFTKMEKEKNRLVLHFDHAPEGLVIRGGKLEGMQLSGATENWVPAEGKIEKGRLVVWSRSVKLPEQVRFGFGNSTIGNLFSASGLPVEPFRTDSWGGQQ